jgi:hypothetical protein
MWASLSQVRSSSAGQLGFSGALKAEVFLAGRERVMMPARREHGGLAFGFNDAVPWVAFTRAWAMHAEIVMSDEAELRATIDQLLTAAGAQQISDNRVAGLRKQVAEQLAAIDELVPKVDQGGTQALVFGRSVPIGGVAWNLVVCAVALTAPALDPTGLSHAAAAGAFIAAANNIRVTIKKLDPVEIRVYEAVAAVAKNKKTNAQKPQANVEEIKGDFAGREGKEAEEIPKDLEDILAGLENKEAIRKTHGPDGSVYYQVPW